MMIRAALLPAAALLAASVCTTPLQAATAAVPAAAVTEPVAQAATTRLRAAKFVLAGAEGLAVTCGDVTATGTTNALLRDFPAGSCTVVVGARRATVTLDAPGQVDCLLQGDSLTCR